MATNRTSRELFNLIKGMSKVEKKQFYQMASRNSTSEDLQILAVYRALNNMKTYSSADLARKVKNIEQRKLSGIKNSLYQLLLESLRLHNDTMHLQLSQLLDYATVLYQKGFYEQALKAIKKMKDESGRYQQTNFLLLAVLLEKKIHILDDCNFSTIRSLNDEMEHYTRELQVIGELSNCGMSLYAYYARYGMLRNVSDKIKLDMLYATCLSLSRDSFYAELYFHQACTYFFLLNERNDDAYAAAQSWVNLFEAHPQMRDMEQLQYQRGLFFLNEIRPASHIVTSDNPAGDSFYVLAMRLNTRIVQKTFDAALLDEAECFIKKLPEAEQKILLCYKAAVVCMGCGHISRANDFILHALAGKNVYRIDLQVALRQFRISIHEKLGNVDLSESLSRSVKRFIKANSFQELNLSYNI